MADEIRGITARCDKCKHEFRLVGDDASKDVDDNESALNVYSCDSMGFYSMSADCPACGWRHDLM